MAKKVNVSVICMYHSTGYIEPLYIVWEGVNYPIKTIKVDSGAIIGQPGLRYTVNAGNNQTRILYLQEGKWYLEQKEYYF